MGASRVGHDGEESPGAILLLTAERPSSAGDRGRDWARLRKGYAACFATPSIPGGHMSWSRRLLNLFRSGRLSPTSTGSWRFISPSGPTTWWRRGCSPPCAREARRRFGHPGIQAEQTRERDLLPLARLMIGDLRYAVRALRAPPDLPRRRAIARARHRRQHGDLQSHQARHLKSLPVSHPDSWSRVKRAVFRESPSGSSSASRQPGTRHRVRLRRRTRFDLLVGRAPSHYARGSWVSGEFFSEDSASRAAIGRTITTAGRPARLRSDRRCSATRSGGRSMAAPATSSDDGSRSTTTRSRSSVSRNPASAACRSGRRRRSMRPSVTSQSSAAGRGRWTLAAAGGSRSWRDRDAIYRRPSSRRDSRRSRRRSLRRRSRPTGAPTGSGST